MRVINEIIGDVRSRWRKSMLILLSADLHAGEYAG
jgi:hypothetical protein